MQARPAPPTGAARHLAARARRSRRPHRRTITVFLLLATTSAVLGVATPVLAGPAVNAIVDGDVAAASSSAWPC